MANKEKTVDDVSFEEDAEISKKLRKNEDNTLRWSLIIIGIIFASVLIPYFWVESNKTFDFGGINWVTEDYENLNIFHGRFLNLVDNNQSEPNLYYNIFLRTDPRKNDVPVSGKLDKFKYGGIISLSPKTDGCRGDLSRVMLDLGAFLKQGVGIGPIESGSTNEEIAKGSRRKFATCDNVKDRTVVIIDVASNDSFSELAKRGITQSKINPNCYTIYAENCDDSAVVEKFIVQSVIDFRAVYPIK